jgi:hypothetical protein
MASVEIISPWFRREPISFPGGRAGAILSVSWMAMTRAHGRRSHQGEVAALMPSDDWAPLTLGRPTSLKRRSGLYRPSRDRSNRSFSLDRSGVVGEPSSSRWRPWDERPHWHASGGKEELG